MPGGEGLTMPTNPLDVLNEMQRIEVAEAMKDPAKRELLMLTAQVQTRDDVAAVKEEATAARKHCKEVCKAGFDKRITSVEEAISGARTVLLTLAKIGGAVVVAAGLALAIYEALK